jgi:hypothetical protein
MAGFLFILPPVASPWGPESGREQLGILIVLQLSREGPLLSQLRILLQLRHGAAAGGLIDIQLEQGAAVMQQPIDIFETVDLLGIRTIKVGQLQLQGSQSLLKQHQPLGNRVDRGSEILCAAADPKRDRRAGHRRTVDDLAA